MGNALRFLYGKCCKPLTEEDSGSLGPHGVSAATVGVSALAQDLYHFEITSQVPEGLTRHVTSSKKAQANWYRKLSEAWREAKPPPTTAEEAARLVIQTLSRHKKADVEGLLAFYGLPLPHTLIPVSTAEPTTLPAGVKFEMQTLPVDARAIPDGDTITVYVSAAEPRESACVPGDVQMAAVRRSKARAERNYEQADALHQKIINAGYRLAIHLIQSNKRHLTAMANSFLNKSRGIDAPESSMPYGKEAQNELIKIVQGKCLRVLVYGDDRYGRCVADLYCNGIFVQEVMLKKGCAWHYSAYDQRSELAKWEKEARAKRVGLWAASNPEEPWEWRKDRREGR
ncbi:hypothetical protein CUMW_052670 [Citrus unshiu]|nr:hypothetical protein CUMW_052670 [Citrus unshiu]